MRKRIFALLLALLLLPGCAREDASETTIPTDPAIPETTEPREPEIDPSPLWGSWRVDGVLTGGTVTSIYMNALLWDLYDSHKLTLNQDGTYRYEDIFIREGTYRCLPGGEYDELIVLMKEVRSYRLAEQEGELVQIPGENSGQNMVIGYLQSTGMLVCGAYDPITGGILVTDSPLYFSKGDARIPKGSYRDILDEYTRKMEEALPRLIRELRNALAGTTDIQRIAELYAGKVGELAAICQEGLQKMYDLMEARGDDLTIYEGWARKLFDNYDTLSHRFENIG